MLLLKNYANGVYTNYSSRKSIFSVNGTYGFSITNSPQEI